MKHKSYVPPKFEINQFEFEDSIAASSVVKSYDTEFNNSVNLVDWGNNEEDAAISNESWF